LTVSRHAKIVPLDLRARVNMGFKDDKSGDGKGGWTDQGDNDFRMMPLEGLWWPPKRPQSSRPARRWNWTLMVRVPPDVSRRDLARAVGVVAENPDAGRLPVADVMLEDSTEGTCVQMVHIGPYDAEPASMAAMHEFAVANGFELSGKHHEIYISDPGRTAPEKMRTLLRYPVRRARK
jgi:hypothetical protein